MRLNYYYNFKNTIRFFMDIENINTSKVDKNKTSWAKPFTFRIRKDKDSFRKLQIPNIYNFYAAYDYYKDFLNDYDLSFETLETLDECKRMKIDYELGEFKENSYNEWQLIDYNNLIEYDVLIRCDIKSFYENIYTHYIFNDLTSDNMVDKRLSHLYNGRTGGIIMGNYISLYAAEYLSAKISKVFSTYIQENKLDCIFSYFSDDFYIFVNKEDTTKILKIFDEVLEKFNMSRNETKTEYYDYLKYTSSDVLEKYWKIISRKSLDQRKKQHEDDKNGDKLNNNLFITNQLIYRIEKIDEYRLKKVFIVNFFKSQFFRKIDLTKTFLDNYNYHQILYIIKNFPEVVLYMDSIFDNFDEFKSEDFVNKIIYFYKKSLLSNYHDEQLYFYYLISKLGVTDRIKDKDTNDCVLKTGNSLLMAYYVKYGIFMDEQIQYLKDTDNFDDEYWLVYYYLIINDSNLFNDLENSILKYLIPSNTTSPELVSIYKEFYLDNLSSKIEILVPINKIKDKLNEYYSIKDKKKDK